MAHRPLSYVAAPPAPRDAVGEERAQIGSAPGANALCSATRLQALQRSGLLTAERQERFDRFVRLTARLLDVPTALVSVVEPHRQFFTSAVGLAEPWASRRETPLSYSFCQHVVAQDAPLVVDDARRHALVADNEAVCDLGVIAYLGAPIRSPEGEVLGSLCAIDGEPRAWTAEDVAALEDLAALLADELVLTEKEHRLRAEVEVTVAMRDDLERQRALLETALKGAPLVLYAFDADGTVTMSRGRALASLGLDDDEAVGHSIWEFFEAGSEAARGARRVLAGQPATWTSTYGGESFETTASPASGGGGVAVAAQVTGRVLAEHHAAAQTANLRRLVTATAVQGTFDVRAQAVLREVADMLGLDGGLLARVENDTYTCLASYAARGETCAPGTTLPLGETYCDLTIRAGDIVAIEHMAASAHRDHQCYDVVGLEAYVGVPVRVDGEVVGALSFSSPEPSSRSFTDADRELVRLAGQWAGGLLEREARDAATHAQVKRLHTLADAFALRTADDRVALAQVLEEIGNLLDLDIGIVSRIDVASEVYEVLACAAPDEVGLKRGDLFALGETYCSITLDADGVVAIDHMQVSEHHRHPCYQAFALETYIGAPVYVGSERAGTISFSSSAPREVPFSGADEDLVRLAARWVGGLLATALNAERLVEAEQRTREREAELALIQRALPDALVVAGPDRRIQRVNPAFSRLFGYAPEDVIGEPTRLCYADDDAFDGAGRSRFNDQADEQLDPYVVRYRRKDGTVFSGETVGTPVRHHDGHVVGYIGLIRDVTERESQRRLVAESEARYRLLAENASDLVCLQALDGTYEWVSPSVEAILGYAPDEIVGRSPRDLFHPEEAGQPFSEVHEKLLRGEESVAELVHRLRHKDGHYIWIESHTRAVLADDGTIRRFRTAARDVSARREMEAQLYHQAHYDALTGLANRTLFRVRLDEAIERCAEDPARYAVLFIDLDRFKVINDTLGHSAGDRLLQKIAARLQNVVRPTDTVARLGGDEFAVLLSNLENDQHAERVAARIQNVLRQPIVVDGTRCTVGASTGIVTDESGHENADVILREADIAMYEAKRAGRGQSATYRADAHEEKVRRLRLEMDLPRAIEHDELRLAYQPIVRLTDGALSGFEALVRWQHPELGLLYPDAFIGAAEESGHLVEVDRWVLQEAWSQMAAWQDTLASEAVLLLNVNCTGRDLVHTGYTDAVRRLSEAHGFDHARLLLEITESLLVEDTEAVAAELRLLQELGIQFCIDDFGTGYSSLSMLHTLPVDRLKIDRSFVTEMEERRSSRALVETIVQLGYLLDKMIVAEGIEHPSHLEALRDMRCTYGQGYLFAKPLWPDEVVELLAADVLPWQTHWGAAA